MYTAKHCTHVAESGTNLHEETASYIAEPISTDSPLVAVMMVWV